MITTKDTTVASEFDSGTYLGTFLVADDRIPKEYNKSNEEVFLGLETTIALAVEQYFDNLAKD